MQLNDPELLSGQAFINGEWIDADNGATFTVTNPATGEVLHEVAECGSGETRRAIEAADNALETWRATPVKERAAILRRWFDLMMAAQEDLARILTAEQGKPLAEARGEIAYGASYIEWFSEEAKRVYGDTMAGAGNDKRTVVIKQPVGGGRLHHTLEFSECHVDAKNRARACSRLHRGLQAGQ